MALFSGNQKDDKVANLEKEAQERLVRIGELRAQIANLTREETKVQAEYDAVQSRVVALRKRSEELKQLKVEEASLTKDIKLREEKHADLIAELASLQETRRQHVIQIGQMRAQVANEEAGAKKERDELARLEKILADNETRREKILADQTRLKKDEEELKTLEKEYSKMGERIQLARKQYEETKRLVETMKKNVMPINQAIMDIWQKLPPDALDQKLVLLQKSRPERSHL